MLKARFGLEPWPASLGETDSVVGSADGQSGETGSIGEDR